MLNHAFPCGDAQFNIYQRDIVTTAVQETRVGKDERFSYQEREFQSSETIKPGIEYPESDGKPMGETGFHVTATMALCEALRHFFRHREDIYVAADMFLYYEKGNRYANKAPDVMVIKGVSNHERRTFKTWEEGAVPCVIFEISSDSTMTDDMVTKSVLYARLGVCEYFLFDPLRDYWQAGLLGFRLENSDYVSLAPDAEGHLFSEELGILLHPEGEILRVIDPQTGTPVPLLEEAVIFAEQEAQRAEQEAQRAKQEAQRAEQEAQRAEQEAQRAEQEAQRAEQEAQRAEQEAQRAEQEAQRAEQEAQRAERLAAQLRAMGIEPDA